KVGGGTLPGLLGFGAGGSPTYFKVTAARAGSNKKYRNAGGAAPGGRNHAPGPEDRLRGTPDFRTHAPPRPAVPTGRRREGVKPSVTVKPGGRRRADKSWQQLSHTAGPHQRSGTPGRF